MLVIMNRYNHTGGSNAFLRVFSCVGNGCGDDAWRRGRAGLCARGQGGGGMSRYEAVVVAVLTCVGMAACATWDAYLGVGTLIQDAIDDAEAMV
jgi:hypothetical protein